MENEYYQMYLEELQGISPCTEEELMELVPKAKQKNEQAINRLIEGNLIHAVAIAGEFRDKGLPIGDLIQEASVALTLFVRNHAGMAETFRQELTKELKKTCEEAVSSQETEQKIEEEMLARVNVLKDVSQMMAEELGREATVEELAQRMQMSSEDIKDIMKLTLDAMSVSPDVEE